MALSLQRPLRTLSSPRILLDTALIVAVRGGIRRLPTTDLLQNAPAKALSHELPNANLPDQVAQARTQDKERLGNRSLGTKDFLRNTPPDVALFRSSRERQRAASAPVDRQPQKERIDHPPSGPMALQVVADG